MEIDTLIPKKNEDNFNIFRDLTETFVISLVVLLIIYTVLAFPEVVSGASMEPSLYGGERILVEKISKYISPLRRGDIVVFHPPGDDKTDYVKRVIGLPGDIVKVFDCKVFISTDGGRYELEENYLYEDMCTEGGSELLEGRSIKVEANSYLLLGDNRLRSADSRELGVISSDRIVGKAVLRFWPLSKLSLL